MSDEPLLDLPEVCARVKLGPDAVRRAVHNGKLEASKLGGRLRFRPEAVDAYIDSQRIVPAESAEAGPSRRALGAVPSPVPRRTPPPSSFRDRVKKRAA